MNFVDHKISASASSAVDLAPVVDVVFNLLIFFALTLNFAISSGIKVEMPKATGEIVEAKDINISISKDGKIYFNDKQMKSAEEVESEFLKLPNKDSLVIIRADSQSLHGPVVETMDIAKNNGFSKIAIGVDPN